MIYSHTVYKINYEDDSLWRLKARIAPHGDVDSFKHLLTSQYVTCSPTGICFDLTFAAFGRWPLHTADVKAAFLQTGHGEPDVYVLPPRESDDKRNYWLLLSVAYGLVSAIAKVSCSTR